MSKEIKEKTLGSRVLGAVLPLICEFLSAEDLESLQYFCYSNKKIYHYFHEKKLNKIKEVYDKMKKAPSKNIFYDASIVQTLVEATIIFNKKEMLEPLVVPSKYFDYPHLRDSKIDSRIYKHYLEKFKRNSKNKKGAIFCEYLTLGDNWKTVTDFIKKIKLKECFELSKDLEESIYSIKSGRFLKNYEKILKKYSKI